VTSILSRQQLGEYERDGILFPIEVLSQDEVSFFRGALESIVEACGEGWLKRFDGLHLFFHWAYRLVTNTRLLDAVEDVLGSDLLIDGTLVFCKPPRDAGYVSWHQDSVYSGWHLTPSTSAWIALTPSLPVNGCMRALPGSHKQGLVAHTNIKDEANMLRRGEIVANVVDESQAIDVALRPGEMSLHHSTLVHGSNPNSSDEPRIGFIVRFITSRIASRDRPVLRVRGNGDCSHLRLAEPPEETDLQTALASWRAQTRNGKR